MAKDEAQVATEGGPGAAGAPTGDHAVVLALRRGDAEAFRRLVDALQGRLLAVARSLLRSPESAREIVQDTWIAVIEGIDRFEERSSLKSWIFTILINRARTRAGKEWRQVPFSALGAEDQEPLLDPALFDGNRLRPDALRWEPDDPEQAFLGGETQAVAVRAVEALPERQRTVLRLHDVEGLDARQICNLLEISETNQRVLLHRARVKVREAIERHLGGREGT